MMCKGNHMAADALSLGKEYCCDGLMALQMDGDL